MVSAASPATARLTPAGASWQHREMLYPEPISAFDDNYIWLLRSPDSSSAVVVDPGDAGPVFEALSSRDLTLGAVLVTHHHHDHVGGASELAARYGIPVFGPAREVIPAVDQMVSGDDVVQLAGLGCYLRVVDLPGHTAGHISYIGPDFAFVGDTLFAGGCGRVFEGTMEEMFESLLRLSVLPPATRIFCGHEYTVANLRFAREVEPENRALTERLEHAIAARRAGVATVPSTMSEELATNPFLRCEQQAVVEAAAARIRREPTSPCEVFAALRIWKDSWRG